MAETRSEFVEFSLYDEILNGRLRPFFVDSFSDREIKKILDELAAENTAWNFENGTDGYFKDERYKKPKDGNLYKVRDGQELLASVKEWTCLREQSNDCYGKPDSKRLGKSDSSQDLMRSFEDYESGGKPIRSPQAKTKSKELRRFRADNEIQSEIRSGQCFPLSPKVEQFEDLIKDEYECIKQRALDLKNFPTSEDELKIVAIRNIEKAQQLATTANELGGLFKKEDPKWGDPNAYIVDMVRCFLVRSIMFYQHHFGPYLDQQLISDDELKNLLGQGEAIWPIIKRLEKEQNYDTNKRAETSSSGAVQKYFEVKKYGNRFVLKDEFWEISYGGNEMTIRNLERIRYIVRLLESPHIDFYCHELALLVKGGNPDACFPDLRKIDPIEYDEAAEAQQGKIHFVDPIEDGISKENLSACINVANDLWQQANDPNIPEEDRATAKEDWKKASNFFSHEYGLIFYKSKTGVLRPKVKRRLKREFEKSRINVKKQISKAISYIASKNPSFSAYLENHIQTGIKCAFKPDPEDMGWTIEWGL